MRRHIAIAILFLLLCSAVARAQDTKTVDTARREKAIELLKSLAGQLGALQSPENRARIAANIADSLWKHDENQARALFIRIEDDINLGLQNCDIREPADRLTINVFLKLRADTIQRIAKYDAELALNFLNATEPNAQIRDRPSIMEDPDRDVEMELAKKIAGANPDIALKLGRQALARRFPSEFLSLLRQLHLKHSDKGETLYKETVQKLLDTDLANDSQAFWFGSALAQALQPPAVDEHAFRDLINALMTQALADKCDKKSRQQVYSPFCEAISPLVAMMEKVDPVRGRKLRPWASNSGEDDETQGAFLELQDVAEDGTAEEILQLATKYPSIDVTVYVRAMSKVYESGDTERARKIANSYPGDPDKREILLNLLDRKTAEMEITEHQFAEERREIAKISVVRTRIDFLIRLASRVGPKNKKEALRLLDEAAESSEGLKVSGDKIEALFKVATSYCSAGSDRGLDMVEAQIPKLNELIDAAAKLDGLDTGYLRDGEWNMSANGRVGSLLTALSDNAGDFARCDFDRAVSLAGQFERSEIRMMAQLKLAQSILAGPKKSPLFFQFHANY